MAGTGRDDQGQFLFGENRKDDFGKSKGRLWKIERTTLGNRKDDFGLAAMEEFIHQKNIY